MSRRRNSKSAKKKKQGHKSSIRSDIWSLDLSSEQKALASLTVLQYRQFLKPLVLITRSPLNARQSGSQSTA